MGALVVFLSSTISDYEDVRRQVKEVLDKKAECACFLSEDWTGGYDATVQKCHKRVMAANGFMLLLGHWYGSVPPGQEKSITHLEFEWAQQRRKKARFENMAVLRPKPGTRIDKKLRQLAQNIIATGAADPDTHAARLKAFHDQVDDRSTEWRIITPFKDVHDLREHALVLAHGWRGWTPLAAARGKVAPTRGAAYDSQLTDAMLGQLGRKPQIDAIEAMMSGVAGYPAVPAQAILVHGDEDAGQRAFLSHLLSSTLEEYYPKQSIGSLPLGQTSGGAFVAWVTRRLGLPDSSRPETPEQLADRVADELRNQPLHFVIDRIGTLEGGISAFREKLWEPFWRRLRQLRVDLGIANRLVAVVTDYSGDDERWAPHTVDPEKINATEDYLKLLRVPKLAAIQRQEVFSWFDKLRVPDDATGRRAKLADFMLNNDHGEADPVPTHVYGRARSQQLWPEGD